MNRFRMLVLDEILTTENKYVEDLSKMIQEYINPIRATFAELLNNSSYGVLQLQFSMLQVFYIILLLGGSTFLGYLPK